MAVAIRRFGDVAALAALRYHPCMLRSVLLLTLVATASPAWATTAVRADVPRLVASADAVAIVRVGDAGSAWLGRRIVTRTEVTVDESWVGGLEKGSTLTIETLGGLVGGIGQSVPGAVRLTPGTRAVLFLARDGNAYRVVGMQQGAVQVADDSTLERDLSGLRLVEDRPVAAFPATLETLRRAVVAASRAR